MSKPRRDPFSRPGVNKFWNKWIDGSIDPRDPTTNKTRRVIENWDDAQDAWLAGFCAGVDWTLIPFKKGRSNDNAS